MATYTISIFVALRANHVIDIVPKLYATNLRPRDSYKLEQLGSHCFGR